jgi:hypothetical protein
LACALIAGISNVSHAANGQKAAEVFIRLMVRNSASLAARDQGNPARMEADLCHLIPSGMSTNYMAQTISNSQNAWTNSPGQQTAFRKAFMMFLAQNAVERLSPHSSVVAISASGSGTNFTVNAQIQSDSVRTSTYWMTANAAKINSVSDADLNALDGEFSGQSAPGSHAATAAIIQSAFSVYTFTSRGWEVVTYLRDRYNAWVKLSGGATTLHPEYFSAAEGIRNSCP